ncbi:MAG: TIGR03619 family F420-dependent LLM class oxidoreductase [Actinomycetota bacterium]
MRLSFKVLPQNVDWRDIRDFWVQADEIPSYYAGWLFDHFVPQVSKPSPDALPSILEVDRPDGPCFEAWTMLTYLAAHTSRVRLGTLVSSATHRHPAVFAKIIATLDELSGGRVELGVGAGWSGPEHEQLGIYFPPLKERFDRFEEYLSVLTLLFSPGPVSFDGRYYSLRDATCNPLPVQKPRPPICVGGKGEQRALPSVARWADHWSYPGGSVEEFIAKRELLGQLCANEGRSIDDLDVSIQLKLTDVDTLMRDAHAYVAAGVNHLVVRFTPPLSRADLLLVADRACSEFDVEAS